MVTARKAQIGAAFAAAAKRYDEGAAVQQAAARRLADMAHREHGAATQILEIGCGTGLLTREIRNLWPTSRLIATDLAPAMIAETARQGIATQLLEMDGEAPQFSHERFDLIFSSLTFQWFEDLPAALARLHALLKPGGSLYFATMGAQSFQSWREAHEREALSAGLPDYPGLLDLQAMVADFADHWASEEIIPLPTHGGRALIRHFRVIGAHVPRPDYRPLGPAAMQRVIANFDQAGGTSSYHILYGKIGHD